MLKIETKELHISKQGIIFIIFMMKYDENGKLLSETEYDQHGKLCEYI